MKNNTKLILTAVALAVSSSTLLAQGLANKWDISGNTTTLGNFLGTLNNQPLNFRTNNTQRMTINDTTGFVGIGTTAPAFRLDANDDINVNTNIHNRAYRINGFPVLQIFGTNNVFVGRGAGALSNNAGINNGDNTFVGNNAGTSNLNGDRNTYIGSRAGSVIQNGRFNTFIGTDAAQNLITLNKFVY